MTPFQSALLAAAQEVVHGCCQVRQVPPLDVVADLKLPTPWARSPERPLQVVVNPQRLRYLSQFVREFELAAWVHELLAEHATPLPQAASARAEETLRE